MLKQLSHHLRLAISANGPNNISICRPILCRHFTDSSGSRSPNSDNPRDENSLKQDLNLTGIHLDDIDQIMSDQALKPVNEFYPKLEVDPLRMSKPFEGHNVVVIQPWISYANFNDITDPELQLDECVSLANTIHNWTVVGKKIVFANKLNTKQLIGPDSFEDLKDHILGHKGVSAVFFGLECLSGVQLSTIERELKMPVYDRFTVVLNIFRQHARTKEAKVQLALAELPYIRSHLREIHESSEYSACAQSLKTLVGGIGEKFYHQRLNILKRRERTLRHCLEDIRKQREITKKLRKKRSDFPLVSVVGYTNSGKTSLIKYLTQDDSMTPKDQLFATLDVTVHAGQLPSSKTVLYLDTVGFLSRIPTLLIESFSATLRECQESDLIVHILDVTHPDHRLQYSTVMKALASLKIPKDLLDTKLTVGNKIDLLGGGLAPKTYFSDTTTLPHCDLNISVTKTKNLNELAQLIDQKLMTNLKHEIRLIRIENGGKKYFWIRKNATILDCQADAADFNYLVCRVSWSPAAKGRWMKYFGTEDFISSGEASDDRDIGSGNESNNSKRELNDIQTS